MDNKKKLARMEMLKALSKKKSSEMHEPKKEKLKSKLQKVTVIAKDKEGLEEGLSKAQQILKAKLGKLLDEDSEEESEHECAACEDEGCEHCEEEEDADE